MKKIVVPLTGAQANMLAFALIRGLAAVKNRRDGRSLAIVASRIADELERVFPDEKVRW